jgi:hypothetical protein
LDFSVNRCKSSLCYTATGAAVKRRACLDYAQQGQHHDHENNYHDDSDYAVGVHATSKKTCPVAALLEKPL